ncbi:hypothetical protein HKX48_008248 [Thoreauomyces humboldtii]|nr:hypothetical protein HKX48_008248 [Thoreauomyces humboldtii]
MQFLAITLASLALAATSVSAHGKLIAPLGLNVNPVIDLNSQADVAIGVSVGNACGQVIAKPNAIDRADTTPRATFSAGGTATITYHIVNQDGAGPLSVSFSPDAGRTWTQAAVSVNAPGRFGINAANEGQKGQDAPVTFTVPNMACPAGSCILQVKNPITFGGCSPVEIVQGGATTITKTFYNSGGKPAGSGLVGDAAGGAGFVDVAGLPGSRTAPAGFNPQAAPGGVIGAPHTAAAPAPPSCA